MRYWLLSTLAIIWFCIPLAGQQVNRPDWVKEHPVSSFSFIGIGMAKLSEEDYLQKAKQNALSDLISEIKVEIAASSLLNTQEDDGSVKQIFTENIRLEARTEIENFRLVDSWQNENEYWVYYELNKDDYEAFMETRRQKAIRNGFDFWYRGNVILQQGDLMTAIELFSNGMEAIRPVLNQELFCLYEGKTINLATELHVALAKVFDGVTIVLSPATVSGIPFQGIKEPVVIGVYRDGNPLRNIRLKSEFTSGSGDLSPIFSTDQTGMAVLYVRNITSKQAQQQISVSLVDDTFRLFQNGGYAALFKKILSSLPRATLIINTEQTQVSAYVKSEQNDLDIVERAVKSLLNNNFFNVVASPFEADVIVALDNKCRKGNSVPGELYNFIEFFSTFSITMTNNRTGQVMLSYFINEERTLVAESKVVSQGMNMVARELIKRLNREFMRELKKITFDRMGNIPKRQQVSSDVPDPAVPIPMVIPKVIPAPIILKEPEQKPQQANRAEWFDGVFIEFDKLTTLGDRSKIHLKVINTNTDDCEVELYYKNVTIVNEKGEEKPAINLLLGSRSSNYQVNGIIVPNLSTKLVIEVAKLQSVALLQLKNFKDNIIKLRNLE